MTFEQGETVISKRTWLAWLRRAAPALVRWAYPLFAGACVLLVGHLFFASMHEQTHGVWSAPLDDVFIHFDFARSTARGYPFQWSEGNGYSSGNTSISYPFILALGYWIGFRDLWLMLWAGIVASVSVFGFLLAAPRLLGGLPSGARFLIPPVVLAVGALDWSLFSGMEVAWFLGVWSLALLAALRFENIPEKSMISASWLLGSSGLLVVATRPEGSTAVAALGLYASWLVWKRTRSMRTAIWTIVGAGSPGVAFIVAQGIVNKILTGDSAAAGALVKLAFYNPYMSAVEKWNNYKFLLSYVIKRNVEYHFSDEPLVGWLLVALGLSALLDPRTRRAAVLLLSSATAFLLLVAMNGQVRWQNERYTMPAVAWFLLVVALAVGASLVSPQNAPAWLRRLRFPRALAALAIVALFAMHQTSKFKDQIWFFGRASRNILDQHVTAGRLIRRMASPAPRRLLVGDAGALIYASDIPGLDIIGLGGYHGLPIARSSVHGMGATVELLEHIPRGDRPDVMALFPTWWGKFPMLFGHHLTSVWVEGNVICGGAEDAIYLADWHLLNTGDMPSSLRSQEKVVDELDVADILSEREHHYVFPRPHAGFVDLRVLACHDPNGCRTPNVSDGEKIQSALRGQRVPRSRREDVLDAGRRIPVGRSEHFQMTMPGDVGKQGVRMIFRSAPSEPTEVSVRIDDGSPVFLNFAPSEGWVEVSVPVNVQPGHRFSVQTETRKPFSWTNYHVWLVVER